MSINNKQQLDLEALRDMYEESVSKKDGLTAIAILNRLKSMGYKKEAETLLANTRVMDLVTPSSIDDWETRDPTQADL